MAISQTHTIDTNKYIIKGDDSNSLEVEVRSYNNHQVRIVWDPENEIYFFSVVDIVSLLTEQESQRNATIYWGVLKKRLREEGASELITNCKQLKLKASDGKGYKTDVADLEQLLRIIQSIPSKKAEPIKKWLAQVGAERIDQMQDPELSINMAMHFYQRLGYSERWISNRIRTIDVRNQLTDEWKRGGIEAENQYAFLTNLMLSTWSGKTVQEYKQYKGIKKESLRDNMTNTELLLNALAEDSATQISKKRNPQGLNANAQVAQEGAEVAKSAKEDLERRLGHSVISQEKAIDYIHSSEELPFTEGYIDASDNDNKPY